MELFEANGFAQTTVDMIAKASGVGRTTVFRYWGSKSDIVWAEFDRHIERLRQRFRDADDVAPTMVVVRKQVVASLGQSMENSPAWMERFAVLDLTPELRPDAYAHWACWAGVVADYIAARHALTPESARVQVAAAATQATFLATLRAWHNAPNPPADLLSDIDLALADVGGIMQGWLDHPRSPSGQSDV